MTDDFKSDPMYGVCVCCKYTSNIEYPCGKCKYRPDGNGLRDMFKWIKECKNNAIRRGRDDGS